MDDEKRSFSAYKRDVLRKLANDTSVDPLVKPLLDEINKTSDHVTILFCQGHARRSPRNSFAMVEFCVRPAWDLIKETDLSAPLETEGIRWVRMSLTKKQEGEYRLSVAFFTELGVIGQQGVEVLATAFRSWRYR